jgi:hypothetical protein
MRLVVVAALLVGPLCGCSSRAPELEPAPPGGGSSGATSVGGAIGGSGAPSSGGSGSTTTVGGNGGFPVGGAGGGSGGEAGGSVGSTAAFSDCILAFPYRDEPELGVWLGGDSAYSLSLDATTALWSFQDTFVGAPGHTMRAGSTLIANTFAYVSCNAGRFDIRYFWREENGARAIFSDGAANQRFWPQQPIIYGGKLFAAMTRVEGGASEIGTTLARVENPYDPPNQWRAEYFELTSLPGLGKGTIVVGDYAYLFGNAGEALVTRLPLEALVAPNAVPKMLLEYLAADGTWQPGLDPAKAKKLGFNANVGTSFRYLAESQRWLVLFTNTSRWPAPSIAISTAPALEGPWSAPRNVYDVPEMTPGSAEYDADTVCYAAIEHPESNPAPETDLLFSYTCNSLKFDKQLANMGIYLPKIVRQPLPRD